LLLFLLCGQKSALFALLFIEDFLEVALSLKVELLNALGVIHCFRVDFFVA
jgi:hypothetical protein